MKKTNVETFLNLLFGCISLAVINVATATTIPQTFSLNITAFTPPGTQHVIYQPDRASDTQDQHGRFLQTSNPSDCSAQSDGSVTLTTNGYTYNAYCKSNKVMLAKINGQSSTWQYSSTLWTASSTYNPTSLAFDQTEAKFDAFNLFPVNSLHLCMSDVGNPNSNYQCMDLALGQTYSSLLAAMNLNQAVTVYGSPSATQYTGIQTSAGRNAWLTMLGQGVTNTYLEDYCNVEGVNINIYDNWSGGGWWQYYRLGIYGNNENDCLSIDSAIGFGLSIPPTWCPSCSISMAHYFSTAAGSVSFCCPGTNTVQRFGYIYGSGCPAGTTPVANSMSCSTCSAGWYSTGSACTMCPAGQYQSSSGQTVCNPCLAGNYQAAAGKTNCLACPGGYNSNAGYTYCFGPTMTPTLVPTSPTHRPTHPTNSPTTSPTTRRPTTGPSKKPSIVPTGKPSSPSLVPTGYPTTFTKYLASFTTVQYISSASQFTLQSQVSRNAFVTALQQVLNTNHSSYLVSVSILSVVPLSSGFGYEYNTTYVVPNGINSKFVGSYQNLSSTIATATANNVISTALVQTCKGTCGLSSSLSLGTPAFTTPAYVQTPTPTSAPSLPPVYPSINPSTYKPTSPTLIPTLFPSSPSLKPTLKPSMYPSRKPSRVPTIAPSIRSLAPTNQGQCFCNVKICVTAHNVTQCAPNQVDVYH